MCVILHLPPSAMPKSEWIENATFNNWHGFGLILRDAGRMEVIKRCPEKGNDPAEIYDLLEDNKGLERILHLRYNTAGETSIQNSHPFTVYNSDKRRVEFMHNGTLHNYKPSHQDTRSDTHLFAENFLRPLLSRFVGLNGKADIEDPFILELIEKNWSSGSRGLLVSNDLDPVFISKSSWKSKGSIETGGAFLASNDDYFDKLVRGPEFEARKKSASERAMAEAARQREEAASSQVARLYSGGDWPVTKIENLRKGVNREIFADLAHIFGDFDFYDDEGLAELAGLTVEEIDMFIEKHPREAAAVMVYVSQEIQRLVKENKDIARKHNNASKHIEKMAMALKEKNSSNVSA